MNALRTIGIKKAFRFLLWPLVYGIFRLLPYPPLRVLYLKLWGAKIGKNTVIHSIKFFNFYRGSFRNLELENNCFIGNDVLLDLAGPIRLGSHVTLAERTSVITHMNVGYAEHPLQKAFPSMVAPVVIEDGCFVGVNTVILAGVTIRRTSFIGASSLVKDDVPSRSFVAGIPAKFIREIKET